MVGEDLINIIYSRIVNQFAYLDNCYMYMLTVEAMNPFGTWFAVEISPGKQDKYHHLVAINTASLQHFPTA